MPKISLTSRAHLGVYQVSSPFIPTNLIGTTLMSCLFSHLNAKCRDHRDHSFALTAHPIMELLAHEHQLEVDCGLSNDEVLMLAIEWLSKLAGKTTSTA